MLSQHRIRFIYGQAAWMLGAFFGLILLDALSLELLFVVSTIGFLVITQYTAAVTVTPPWRRGLRWFILIALLVILAMLVQDFLAMLPPGVL